MPKHENLNDILTEIVFINQCNISFEQYYMEKISKPSDIQINQRKNKNMQQTKRDKWIKEILEFYAKTEETFLQQTTKAALSAGQIIKQDSLVSDTTDNVFFIFKRSYQRAFETKNFEISCRICQVIVQLVEHNLKKVMVFWFNNTSHLTNHVFCPSFFSLKEIMKWINNYFDQDESKIDFLAVLNDVSMIIEYLSQLSQEMTIDAKHLFSNPEQFTSIQKYILITKNKTEDFQTILAKNIMKILEMRQYHLASIISDSLSPISYSITADQFQEREANSPLISTMTKNFHDFLSKYKVYLASFSVNCF